jgi:peptidoglycan/xylan/chitin deacetylase (PgdA/CDA1 family)
VHCGRLIHGVGQNNWGCIYDYADEIIAAHNAGWTLGSHGWSHAHMGELTWDQAHNELWLVEQAFEKILGLRPLCTSPVLCAACDVLTVS